MKGRLPVMPAGDSVRTGGAGGAAAATCSRTAGATGAGLGVAISGIGGLAASGARIAAISGVTIGFGAVITVSRGGRAGVAISTFVDSTATAGTGTERGASTGADTIAGNSGIGVLAAVDAGVGAAGRGAESDAAC